MSNKNYRTINKGLTFPFKMYKGKPLIEEDKNLIESNIRNTLATPLSDLDFEEDFGTDVASFLEEPSTITNFRLLTLLIQQSLEGYDTITVSKVVPKVNPDRDGINIHIYYTINSTGVEEEYVQPLI